ncbi:MAG TPA: YHS domain-containing (seleno)protein [Chitinophagaceae bacterium]|nr:YHS domain-containing (seleno)protein [Chitinophagaceae bacterium]
MKRILPFLLLFIILQLSASAQPDKRKKDFNLSASSLAIEGYDPVAYFTQSRAVKGNAANALVYEGVTYHFADAKNKEAFRAAPSRYEPQYGGWCAYAMGKNGEKVEVDPETFKILDGKLYLFYNKYFNNTLKSWNKDENGLRYKADQNWQKLTK